MYAVTLVVVNMVRGHSYITTTIQTSRHLHYTNFDKLESRNRVKLTRSVDHCVLIYVDSEESSAVQLFYLDLDLI